MKFDTPATTNPIDQLKVVGTSAGAGAIAMARAFRALAGH